MTTWLAFAFMVAVEAGIITTMVVGLRAIRDYRGDDR